MECDPCHTKHHYNSLIQPCSRTYPLMNNVHTILYVTHLYPSCLPTVWEAALCQCSLLQTKHQLLLDCCASFKWHLCDLLCQSNYVRINIVSLPHPITLLSLCHLTVQSCVVIRYKSSFGFFVYSTRATRRHCQHDSQSNLPYVVQLHKSVYI